MTTSPDNDFTEITIKTDDEETKILLYKEILDVNSREHGIIYGRSYIVLNTGETFENVITELTPKT